MDNLDDKTERGVVENIRAALEPLLGQSLVEINAEAEYHSLDSTYGPRSITLRFANGAVVNFAAFWCNDSTADLDIHVSPPEEGKADA